MASAVSRGRERRPRLRAGVDEVCRSWSERVGSESFPREIGGAVWELCGSCVPALVLCPPLFPWGPLSTQSVEAFAERALKTDRVSGHIDTVILCNQHQIALW